MEPTLVARATAAAVAVAESEGLPVRDAVVLFDSNKLTLRLRPADVVARVAPVAEQDMRFEIEVAGLLAAAGSPVVGPDPRAAARVHVRDEFAVTFWTYHHVGPEGVSPAGYAGALARLHAGMCKVEVAAPHFSDRVAEAVALVDDRARTPALSGPDRRFLGDTLRSRLAAVTGLGRTDQLLHGEPHPGNLLGTRDGPLFIDFETCCRGPVEFDLAHAPDEVDAHYPGADAGLLRDCRVLVLAMITAWRWDRDDVFPDGRRLGEEWLRRLRG